MDGIVRAAREHGRAACGYAVGSMWGVHFVAGPVSRYSDLAGVDRGFFGRFFHACLERGVFLPPSPFEACFLSTAHTDAEIDATLEAVESAFHEGVR